MPVLRKVALNFKVSEVILRMCEIENFPEKLYC